MLCDLYAIPSHDPQVYYASQRNFRFEKQGNHENVQSDWNATDATSDAFILNKPNLSNYITNSQEFTYEYNESQESMTIQELFTYIAGLEARIKILEDAASSTPTT